MGGISGGVNDGQRVPVTVRLCFPWKDPESFISLRDAEGMERVLIKRLQDLEPESRALLEGVLAISRFTLEISQIVTIEKEIEMRTWKVTIDGELRTFQTELDQWPHTLPDGRILVTERAGRLRLIRDGVLDPQAISGVPEVRARGLAGLMDVAIHPGFAENQLVYLTYSKPGADGVRVALARGRLAGAALVDVADIFVSDPVGGGGTAASRVVFWTDGTLFVTVGGAFRYGAVDVGGRAQSRLCAPGSSSSSPAR